MRFRPYTILEINDIRKFWPVCSPVCFAFRSTCAVGSVWDWSLRIALCSEGEGYIGVPSGWVGGGKRSSVEGTSASRKESVERVLMRRGARRWRSLGDHGSRSWALWEGATTFSTCTAATHGGVLIGPMYSSSGMKAGFSIPAMKEGSGTII